MRFQVGLLLAAMLLLGRAEAASAPDAWKREWPHTDFTRIEVEIGEIDSNLRRDSIQSIDRPRFVSVADVELEEGGALVLRERYSRRILAGNVPLSLREPVISFVENGDARAYPLRIMMFHEIVNDIVGGRPVAVTFCPLCNAAVVLDRRIDGRTLEFGTTGKLRHSDLIMYDRSSYSWWQQYTGAGIIGEFAGRRLERLAARLESVESFARRFPDGRVLMPDEGSTAPYGRNPYLKYDSAHRPFLYRGGLPEGIKPLARVVVIEKTAYSLALLQQQGQIDDGVYRLTWRGGQASALDTAEIAEGRDVGNVVVEMRLPDGSWTDAPHDIVFAFAFHAFTPDGVWRK